MAISTPPRPGFFAPKALLLAVVLIVGYICAIKINLGGLNVYEPWYRNRISFLYGKMDSLNRMSSWNERMFTRHVANYEIPQYVQRSRKPGDIVLLPPRGYVEQYMRSDVYWTDPRIFTYMTELSAVIPWDDVQRRSQANAFIMLEPRGIQLIRRAGRFNVDSLLEEYAAAEQAGK